MCRWGHASCALQSTFNRKQLCLHEKWQFLWSQMFAQKPLLLRFKYIHNVSPRRYLVIDPLQYAGLKPCSCTQVHKYSTESQSAYTCTRQLPLYAIDATSSRNSITWNEHWAVAQRKDQPSTCSFTWHPIFAPIWFLACKCNNIVHVCIIMPRCACTSEVYGTVRVCLCVCACVSACVRASVFVDYYSCSRINEVQVRVSIGF